MAQPKKYNKTAQWLLDLNASQSVIYSTPEARAIRHLYREKHPTEISAFKCMDGRLNLPVFTQTPPGIIQPFRTLGGVFNMGDERLGKLIEEQAQYSKDKHRRFMPLCTYHFSKGNVHRGCKGHKYDTLAAMKGAKRLVEEFICLREVSDFVKAFGHTIYPVLTGIETDHEALLFHSVDGKIFSVEEHLNATYNECKKALTSIFPDMPEKIVEDLLRLIDGNQKHIKEVIGRNRPPIELDHQENVLCFGRGFDWLHTPNKALIVGPFGNDLGASITTAGNLLLGNIKANAVDPMKGIVIMTAGLYYNEGMNKNRIQMKSYDLYRYAKSILEKNVPELFKYDVQYLVGVTNHHTRAFTEIDVAEYAERYDKDFPVSDEERNAIAVVEEIPVVQLN